MKSLQYLFSGIILIFTLSAAHGVKIEFHTFKNKQQEALYLELIAELRCVKCQNQNLAESNAELAKDMRDKTYEMIINGGTRQDVVTYMTDRYGDFVLYKPPFEIKTLLLWFGPALFLLFSLYLLFNLIRKQQTTPVDSLNDSDRESVRDLLKSNESSSTPKR